MRKPKYHVAKQFLKNHAKTIKISYQETTCPLSRLIFALLQNIPVLLQDRTCSEHFLFLMSVVAINFCFAAKHSGFVAIQNLFKSFPFSECDFRAVGRKI